MNTITKNEITKLGAQFTVIEKHLQKKVSAATTQPFSEKPHNNIYVEKIDALHKASGNFTKVVPTSTDKKQDLLKNINVGFAPVQDGSFTKIKGVQLVRVITAIAEGKFNKPVAEYKKAKATSETKVSKDSYLAKFTPHGFKIDGFHKIESTDEGLNTFTANGVFHADLDNIPENELNRVWDALLTTKPFFMMVSPSKDGIKCFWLSDLYTNKDSYKTFAAFKGDRKAHMNMNRIMVKDLLKVAGIVEYYDQAPTNNNSLCYVSDDTRIHLDDDFNVYSIKQALAFINNVNKQNKNIDGKIKNVRSNMSELGAKELKLTEKIIDARVQATIDKFSNNTKSFATGDGNGASFLMACSMIAKGVDDARILIELDSFKARFSKRPTWTAESKLNSAKANGSKPVVELEFNGADKVAFDELESELKALNDKKAFVNNCLRAVCFVDEKVVYEQEKKTKIESMIAKTELTGKHLLNLFEGMVGAGKSYKTNKLMAQLLAKNEDVILAVHSKDAITKRINERGGLNDAIIEEFGALKGIEVANTTIKVQSGNDGEMSYQNVSQQFESGAMNNDRVNGCGRLFLITHAAMMKLPYDVLTHKKNLFIDDDTTILERVELGLFNNNELKEYLSYFDFDMRKNAKNEDVYCFKGIKGKEYLALLDSTKGQGKNAIRTEVTKTYESLEKYKDSQLIIEVVDGDKGVMNKLTVCSMLSANIMAEFETVNFVGDNIMNNFNVMNFVKNHKVKVNEFTKYNANRYNFQKVNGKVNVGLWSIAGENKFTINKMKTQERIVNGLSDTVSKLFKKEHRNILFSSNRATSGFKEKLDGVFEVTTVSTNTRGANNFMDNTLVVCGGVNTLNPTEMKAVCNWMGITQAQVEDSIRRDSMVQNFFRGCLRKGTQSERFDFITPDNEDAKYLKDRLVNEFGNIFDIKINCLDSVLEGYFANESAGRKVLDKSKGTLNGAEKIKISRLYKRFGKDEVKTIIDKIGVDELLNKMNGLRGAKAEEMFNSLLLSVTLLLEGNTGDNKVTLSEDVKSDKIIILKGNSDNNESIENNKIYDELFNQDAANDPVIDEQPIQFKAMDNSQLINFG